MYMHMYVYIIIPATRACGFLGNCVRQSESSSVWMGTQTCMHAHAHTLALFRVKVNSGKLNII